jgi:putative ABC transport system permease protein
MKILALLGLAFGALKERKLRSALTILMVVIGTSLMISLNGMNAGLNEFIAKELSMLGPNVIIVTPTPIIERIGSRPIAQITINYQVVKTLAGIPHVKTVAPYIRASAVIVSQGSRLSSIVIGIDPTKLPLVIPSLKLKEGDLASPSDTTKVILGYSIAFPKGENKPFARKGHMVSIEYTYVEDSAGRHIITTKKRGFIVNGIIAQLGFELFDEIAYITLPAAEGLFKKGKFDGVYVIAEHQKYNEFIEAKINEIYKDTLSVTTPQTIMKTIENIISGLHGFIFSVAAVSMLVGAVGIVASLYTSVMERTKEIGLLKALGYTDFQVLMIFLSESMLIGMIGGTLGIFGGMFIAQIVTNWVKFTPSIPKIYPVFKLEDLWFVFSFAVVLSIVAGLYPAWRAAKLRPVEALRHE